mgnify:CR=1 FL=1
MYTYENIIGLADTIDSTCEAIISMEQVEDEKLSQLKTAKQSSSWNVSELNGILAMFGKPYDSFFSSNDGRGVNIRSLVAQGSSINVSNLLKDYKATTTQILSLQAAISFLETEIPRIETMLETCYRYIQEIEGSPNFGKWVKASEKYLHKYMLPKDPPTGLSDVLIDNELSEILYKIERAGSFMESAESKLRYGFLYRVYRNTIEKESSIGMTTNSYISGLKEQISSLKSSLTFLKGFLNKIHVEASNLLSDYE